MLIDFIKAVAELVENRAGRYSDFRNFIKVIEKAKKSVCK